MALYFTKEEAKELKANTSFPKVLDYLSIPTKKKGNQVCILCPNPEHDDKHYGSCVVKEDGAYCYACHTKITAAKLLIDYEGMKPNEAFTVMADIMGVTALYEQSGKSHTEIEEDKKKRKKEPKFLYNEEDAKIIGLHPFPFIERTVKLSCLPFESQEKNSKVHTTTQEDGEPLYIETMRGGNPLRDFEKEDPEAFRYLMQTKARERMFEAAFTYELIKNQRLAPKILKDVLEGQDIDPILNAMRELYEDARRILIKYGGKVPSIKELAAEMVLRHKFSYE